MILLLLSWATLTAAWWQNSQVLTLTSSTFDALVGGDKAVVVDYFAPWCHWCRKMFHDYESVWAHYNSPEGSGYTDQVIVARLNADDHLETSRRQGIQSFPSIVFYKPGHDRPSHYFHGDRNAAAFIAWIDNLLGKPSPVETLPEGHHHSRQNTAEEHSGAAVEGVDDYDDEEVEESLEDDEDVVQYEIVLTDFANSFNDKWRGEFTNLQITLDDLRSVLVNDLADLRVTQADMLTHSNSKAALDGNRFHALEERLDRLQYEVMNRNRVEAAQVHINPYHMFVFLTIGVVLGCAIALVISKTKTKNHY
jgi:thioredoxin-like negative regulator of GroEL